MSDTVTFEFKGKQFVEENVTNVSYEDNNIVFWKDGRQTKYDRKSVSNLKIDKGGKKPEMLESMNEACR